MTATLVRVTPDSDAGCVHTLIELDDRSSCFVFEVMRDASATRCENVASGLCTPGAAPCRAGPVDLATAASSLIVAVAVGSAIERMSATVEGANVIVVGSDGTKHLVCESLPLARGTPESEACLNDPKLDVTVAASGWCYRLLSASNAEQSCPSRRQPRNQFGSRSREIATRERYPTNRLMPRHG